MSIASPTLRSSSTMVPLLSFKSWLTSMPDLPSTADTVTGTSKTASRSAELFLASVSCCPSVCSSDVLSAAAGSRARSGSSTSSLFAMVCSFVGAIVEIPGNQFLKCGFECRFGALCAAAAPFDAAIGTLERGVGRNLHLAFIGFVMRDLGDASRERGGDLGRRFQHDAGLADRLVHGLAQCRFDLRTRKLHQRRIGELPRDGESELRAFLEPCLTLAHQVFEGLAHGLGNLA